MSSVRPLLHPRSLAIVGASPRNEDAVLTALESGIPVYGVNPGRDEVHGLRCWPSVAELPEVPETAMLVVNHERVEAALDDALAAGVRAFVVPGIGAEAGAAGREITERVAARVRGAGGSMVGPNCMGVVVPGGASAWIGRPPPTTLPGHVAMLCQSGSMADAFLSLGGRVGIRCVVSLGAEAVTGVADYLDFLADDDGTRAIGLFLETVRRPGAFAAGLARCAEAGKPVVCLKVGPIGGGGPRGALAHGSARRLGTRVLGRATTLRRDPGRRLPRADRDPRGTRPQALAEGRAHRRRLGVGRRVWAAGRPGRDGRRSPTHPSRRSSAPA